MHTHAILVKYNSAQWVFVCVMCVCVLRRYTKAAPLRRLHSNTAARWRLHGHGDTGRRQMLFEVIFERQAISGRGALVLAETEIGGQC